MGSTIAANETKTLSLEDTYNSTRTLKMTSQEPSVLRLISSGLLHYVLPLIIMFGTLGNVLALAVLVRHRMRTKSVYCYMAILACADTLVLYVSGFKFWVLLQTGFELLHVSALTCKVTIFMILFSQHMAAWLITFLTVDRFISVWLPFQSAWFCTVRQARIMVGVLALTMALYNSHVFFTFDLHRGSISGNATSAGQKPPKPKCTIAEDHPFRWPFEWIKSITYVVVPSLCVIVLNSCIIYKISRKGDELLTRSGSIHTRGAGSARIAQQRNKVTLLLLIVTFAWLVLTVPYGVLSIIPRTAFTHNMELFQFLRILFFLLFYLNHSVNFYIYCLTGKKFRRELVDLYLCICHCGRKYFMRRRSARTQRTPILNVADAGDAPVIGAHFSLRQPKPRSKSDSDEKKQRRSRSDSDDKKRQQANQPPQPEQIIAVDQGNRRLFNTYTTPRDRAFV